MCEILAIPKSEILAIPMRGILAIPNREILRLIPNTTYTNAWNNKVNA